MSILYAYFFIVYFAFDKVTGLLMRPEHSETKAKTETRECETEIETETETKNNM